MSLKRNSSCSRGPYESLRFLELNVFVVSKASESSATTPYSSSSWLETSPFDSGHSGPMFPTPCLAWQIYIKLSITLVQTSKPLRIAIRFPAHLIPPTLDTWPALSSRVVLVTLLSSSHTYYLSLRMHTFLRVSCIVGHFN